MCLLVLTNSCFGSEERLVSGFVRSLRVLLGIILVAGILLLGFFGDKIYRSAAHSRLPTARTPSQSASSAFGTLWPSVPRRRADRETLRVFVLSFVLFSPLLVGGRTSGLGLVGLWQLGLLFFRLEKGG